MVSTDMSLNNYQNVANTVIGVLVLYKIKLEESSTFLTLTKALKKLEASMDLVIYDNSPSQMIQSSDLLRKENWTIHYIHDSANPGVSKAYNEGAKIGQRLGKQWIILLDQDTTFPLDIFSKYLNVIQDSKPQNIVAPYLFQEYPSVLLSPSGYKFKRGFPLKDINQPKSGENSFYDRTLLSSGLLINLKIFKDLGGYNENLKLDFSDFYFIDKFRKSYSSFYLIDSQCLHGLSRSEETSLEKSLIRFSICCQAAHHFPESTLEFLQVVFYLFLRSCKLSLIHKTLLFQKIIYKSLAKSE
jgi:rhamnosyltransferase